jgi:hypothetical protein
VRRIAGLVLAACLACASRGEPVVDLTPWTWTWSQVVKDGWVIRFAHPEQGSSPPAQGGPPAAAMPPVRDPAPGSAPRRDFWDSTRFATFDYGCAREDRAEAAACSVFLDFWLVALDPPLAGAEGWAYHGRFARAFGAPPPGEDGAIRDSRGRVWARRTLRYASGARYSHYSLPLDASTALAVTSYTTRAPDRVVANDLARDAVERILFEPGR